MKTLNLSLLWILFSLLAIAYIGQRPYLGLTIAVVGGIIFGIASFLSYELEPPTRAHTSGRPDDQLESTDGDTNEQNDTTSGIYKVQDS